MSPIETLMVAALGASVTLVIVLLFGRALWGVAMRSGASRKSREMPVEMLELQADRDRMRAEHALMSRKLDLRVDDMKIRMAEQMAEISRNRNRVQSLQDDLNTRDEQLKEKAREAAALNAQIDILRTELETANKTLKNVSTDLERNASEIDGLQKANRKLDQNNRKLDQAKRETDQLAANLSKQLKTAKAAAVYSPTPAFNAAPSLGRAQIATATEAPVEDRLRQRVAMLTSYSDDLASAHSKGEALIATEVVPPAQPVLMQPTADLDVEQAPFIIEVLDEPVFGQASPETSAMRPAGPSLVDGNAALQQAENAQERQKPGSGANVISLAQRIRALQRDVNEN